jgi:pyridoxine 5-phosphate synthase
MVSLSVNLNKVALLRNARALDIPDPVHAARLVLEAGAGGITVHPRPDERHIRLSDVRRLAAMLRSSWPAGASVALGTAVEFNIEGNPLHQLMDHVRAVRPHQCTFVPDEAGASTSDHGWDLARDGERLRPLIAEARSLGCRVSLFVDGEASVMARAREIGADRVELYTEPYARAHGTAGCDASLRRYRGAAEAALRQGLGVNAGHDLNRDNLAAFLAAVPGVLEVSIGHALIADALEFGLTATVGLYLAQIRRAESWSREPA